MVSAFFFANYDRNIGLMARPTAERPARCGKRKKESEAKNGEAPAGSLAILTRDS